MAFRTIDRYLRYMLGVFMKRCWRTSDWSLLNAKDTKIRLHDIGPLRWLPIDQQLGAVSLKWHATSMYTSKGRKENGLILVSAVEIFISKVPKTTSDAKRLPKVGGRAWTRSADTSYT